jgi:hypothetical protein
MYCDIAHTPLVREIKCDYCCDGEVQQTATTTTRRQEEQEDAKSKKEFWEKGSQQQPLALGAPGYGCGDLSFFFPPPAFFACCWLIVLSSPVFRFIEDLSGIARQKFVLRLEVRPPNQPL